MTAPKRRSNAELFLGPGGSHNLLIGEGTGKDPLGPYGQPAPRRGVPVSTLGLAGDIVLPSAYEVQTDEVTTLELLVASHGTRVSAQSRPFLPYPSDLPAASAGLFGAQDEVHPGLRRWFARLGHEGFAGGGAGPVREGAAGRLTSSGDDGSQPAPSAAWTRL